MQQHAAFDVSKQSCEAVLVDEAGSCLVRRKIRSDRSAMVAFVATYGGNVTLVGFEAESASLAAVLALPEARVDEARRCPHCRTGGAVIRGRSNGLRRYCCKGCGKTFNALTGTPLARLRKKELWAAFAEGLGEGDTVEGAAARCGVAGSTSFRWRRRFLAAVKAGSIKLKGIVEADETYVLTSRKGAKKLDRKPRKRGGVARERGLSKEQVPILVAADRSGATFTPVLPDTTAATIKVPLETAIEPDALLVTDGAPFFPPYARALGISHKPLDRKAGERRRGDLQLNTTGSRHERLRPSAAAAAASPRSSSTATSPGTTSRSCQGCRRHARSWQQLPGSPQPVNHQAWLTLIEPNFHGLSSTKWHAGSGRCLP